MLVRLPQLPLALESIMQRVMAEMLDANTSPERLASLEAVRSSLLAAWPSEIEEARRRLKFVPSLGGVCAMFEADDDDFRNSTESR